MPKRRPVEAVLHKELIRLVENINREYNLEIEDVSFDWHRINGVENKVLECTIKSKHHV